LTKRHNALLIDCLAGRPSGRDEADLKRRFSRNGSTAFPRLTKLLNEFLNTRIKNYGDGQGARLNTASQHLGSIEVALAHARRLLETNPELACEQAREILSAEPGQPAAWLILGAAHRRAGRVAVALEQLEPLASEFPDYPAAQLELGLARLESGRCPEAVEALRRAAKLQPTSPDAWRLLAAALDAQGDHRGADQARVRYVQVAVGDPRLREAAAALNANDLSTADTRLRTHLEAYPTDVAALRMRAEVAGRLRRYSESETLLRRCLALSPSFDAARHNLAVVLNRQARPAAARNELEQLLAKDPRDPAYLNLKAAILANLGDYAESIEVYERVLRAHPQQPKVWMSLGHALRTQGRIEQAVDAYRMAIRLDPLLGEAYWSLANLKTFRFSPQDIAALESAVVREGLADEERLHFEFALGKAMEDEKRYEESFRHYSFGNQLRKKLHPYDPRETTRFVERCKEHWTSEFFGRHEGEGAPAGDPIFIVGMPRAGSTLVEQILASHSQVEGTSELPELPRLVRELAGGDERIGEAPFFDAVARLGPADLARLGEEYLHSTRVHRKSAAPFFIDKMPNNCLYVGLIRLILPNAKIIDVRRHPLGCCFSVFKQQFARGQDFAFDLADLGSYYRDYVDLMAHVDSVLPGVVHRVSYESLIENTEYEVRRLLDHCGLPFEAACLKFYENDRAVRTPSSEQVRQPIFTGAMEHWRHYEPWLGSLKEALGTVVEGRSDARAELQVS
jgi:tetratricopeptide (TPR) repeat protein